MSWSEPGFVEMSASATIVRKPSMRCLPALRRVLLGPALGIALLALPVGVRSARAQTSVVPVDGLELWVKADGPMKLTGAGVTEWTDLSPKANSAIHDAFGPDSPALATANGKPTFRFSGVFTGFHFREINTIRTVFAVLSKAPTSCLPTLPNYGTPAKFWLGGNAGPTYWHPQHGCNIYNANLSEVSPFLVNGKTYLNGMLVEGRTTRFPFALGVLSVVSTANVVADTIARDRNFQDRSWQGDISELLIYNKPLDDATRVSIEDLLARKYAIGAPGGGDGGTPSAVPDAGAQADAASLGANGGMPIPTPVAQGDAGSGDDGGSGTPGLADALAADAAPLEGGAGDASNSGASGGSPAGIVSDAGLGPTNPSNGCACATTGRKARDNAGSGVVLSILVGATLLGRARRRRQRPS